VGDLEAAAVELPVAAQRTAAAVPHLVVAEEHRETTVEVHPGAARPEPPDTAVPHDWPRDREAAAVRDSGTTHREAVLVPWEPPVVVE
jgi:hypothetical protein